MYIFGNWDHEWDYATNFGPSCHHLHLTPKIVDGYVFAGFSGLPANWGYNPIAKTFRDRVNSDFADLLFDEASMKTALAQSISAIDSAHQVSVDELRSRAIDRRKREYREKLGRLEERRWARVRKAEEPLRTLHNSPQYSEYWVKCAAASKAAYAQNRAALVDAIKDGELTKTIVVTHERLSRTKEDLAEVPLFLFGHRHSVVDKPYAGSRFVNVSALDNRVTVVATGADADDLDEWRTINDGQYVIIEMASGSISVTPRPFAPDFSAWDLVPGEFYDSAPEVE